MENPRPEKVAVVDEVRQRLDGADATILTEYRGLTVAELAELRRALATVGVDYKIYKNTLVKLAIAGRNAVMPVIERISNKPYRWRIGVAKLADIANKEKMMPRDFITEDGFHITPQCRAYISPLIQGEAPPPYKNGLPDYVRLRNVAVQKKLPEFKV